MEDVIISNINMDMFTSLGIKPAEVLANALRESGLISAHTTINGMNPVELCNSFLDKKSNYQQLTKLGNLLVKNRVITLTQLKDALSQQSANPSQKLGNVLISMGACSKYDIEHCMKSQNKIREDIQKLEEYEDKVDLIRKRLSGGRISNDHI